MTVEFMDRPGLLLTEIQLLAWIGQAHAQDTLEYHRGFLALDRIGAFSLLTESQIRELSRVAHLAFHAADIGIADLVQRRIGPSRFSYLIIARKRPSGALPAQLRALLEPPSPTKAKEALAHAA